MFGVKVVKCDCYKRLEVVVHSHLITRCSYLAQNNTIAGFEMNAEDMLNLICCWADGLNYLSLLIFGMREKTG